MYHRVYIYVHVCMCIWHDVGSKAGFLRTTWGVFPRLDIAFCYGLSLLEAVANICHPCVKIASVRAERTGERFVADALLCKLEEGNTICHGNVLYQQPEKVCSMYTYIYIYNEFYIVPMPVCPMLSVLGPDI